MRATLERLRKPRTHRGEDGGFTLIDRHRDPRHPGQQRGLRRPEPTGSSAKASCGGDFKAVETATEAYKAQVGIYPGGCPVPSGWTLNPTSSVASGYPPNALPPTPTTNYTSAMEALLWTASDGATSVGPWLKDPPYNPSHYSIVLSDDRQGTVQVADSAGNIVLTGCVGVS
jgi:hypothetical protein